MIFSHTNIHTTHTHTHTTTHTHHTHTHTHTHTFQVPSSEFQVELNMNIVLLSIKNTILTENLDSNISQDILIKNQYILHPMKVDFYINNSILKNKIQISNKN